ncbi:MAG: hypothetical protein OXU73_00930 [Candidatus Campbellbacteria bacterium]|nr:hypothetical protein [Candidatus Campbellbacteria bacterium]
MGEGEQSAQLNSSDCVKFLESWIKALKKGWETLEQGRKEKQGRKENTRYSDRLPFKWANDCLGAAEESLASFKKSNDKTDARETARWIEDAFVSFREQRSNLGVEVNLVDCFL